MELFVVNKSQRAVMYVASDKVHMVCAMGPRFDAQCSKIKRIN